MIENRYRAFPATMGLMVLLLASCGALVLSGAIPSSPTPNQTARPVSGFSAIRDHLSATPATGYAVTFTETGLYSGTNWSVTLNGTQMTSISTAITFTEPAGSYAFTVASLPGYQANPSSGWVGVNRTSANVSVTFSLTYTLTFKESGLPSGTHWSITLDNLTNRSSATTSLSFTEPNGTYDYTVGAVTGYAGVPGYGNVTINGGSQSVTITYARTYSITFQETGLSGGTFWDVYVHGTWFGSNTSSIIAAEPNGTYGWSVAALSQFAASPSRGNVTISGAAAKVTVKFHPIFLVAFHETGLATSTPWSLSFNGSLLTDTGTIIATSVPNGSFAYSVTTVVGYSSSPSSGTVTVNGASRSVTIGFTPTPGHYYLGFVENGLANGTHWAVNVSGTTRTASSPSDVFLETNGTHPFQVYSVYGYTVSPASGSASIAGANSNVSIRFAVITYAVQCYETGLPTGTAWAINVSGVSHRTSNSSLVFYATNGAHTYTAWAAGGYGSPPGSFYVNGSYTNGSGTMIRLVFGPTYNVTFTENGLTSGTQWAVNVSGAWFQSSARSLIAPETNGSYGFAVGYLVGFSASPSSGNLTVRGKGVSITLNFTTVKTFSVTFSESGLPSGTNWSVSITSAGRVNLTGVSSTASISFTERNGTYAYSVASPPGFASTPANGTIVVAGSPVTVSLSFIAQKASYPVTFWESGLASGVTWSVDLGGTNSLGTSGTNLSFSEPNGSYAFTLGSVSGYSRSPASGTVVVQGGAMLVKVAFSRIHTLSFVESGLASGTSWSVTVNGSTLSSTSSTVSFSETDGSYRYSVAAVSGYNVSGASTGFANISGKNLSVALSFQASNSTGLTSLSFSASGLPSGASWSVALTATIAGLTIEIPPTVVRSSTAPTPIRFQVSQGSYSYASSSSGFKMVSGNVTISGSTPRSLELGFVASPHGPPTRSLPDVLQLSGWGGAIGVAIAIVGASGLAWTVVRTRQNRKELGRTLVSGVLATEWTVDGHGDPEIRTKR